MISLEIGFDRCPSPHVAIGQILALRGRDVFLLAIDEAPDLVALNAAHLHTADMLIMIGGANLARVDHQLDHGVLARARQAGNGADRATLAQKVQNAGALGGGQLFHWFIVVHFALHKTVYVDFVVRFALQDTYGKDRHPSDTHHGGRKAGLRRSRRLSRHPRFFVGARASATGRYPRPGKRRAQNSIHKPNPFRRHR